LNLTLATVDSHLYGVCSIAEILLDSKQKWVRIPAASVSPLGLP